MVTTYEKTLKITCTVAAGTAVNSILPAKIVDDPTRGAVDEVTVPVNQKWAIVDVFVDSEQGDNGYLEPRINDRSTGDRVGPINTLLVSNPSRPRVRKLYLGGGDKLSFRYINASSPSSDVTVTVYAKVAVAEK